MTQGTNLEQRVQQRFLARHPREAAVILETLPGREAAAMLSEAPAEVVSAVLRHTVASAAAALLGDLSIEHRRAVLSEAPVAVAANLLRRVSVEEREAHLESVPMLRRRMLAVQLSHDEQTAGALMDPEELVLPDDISVREARSRVIGAAERAHYNVYVVNREQELVGVLNLSELFSAQPNDDLATVMHDATERLRADADPPTVLDHPGWRRVSSLPVVDSDGKFLGTIRYQVLRQLEARRDARRAAEPASTSMALAELYATGLGALFRAIGTTVTSAGERAPVDRS